jgi:hypothetical protein
MRLYMLLVAVIAEELHTFPAAPGGLLDVFAKPTIAGGAANATDQVSTSRKRSIEAAYLSCWIACGRAPTLT